MAFTGKGKLLKDFTVSSLTTANKTIPGAINELKAATNQLNSDLTGYKSDDNSRHWWEFPDGTLICSRRLQLTVPFDVSWASGLYLAQDITMGSFPVEFVETPNLTVSVYSAAAVIPGSYGGTTIANAGNINLFRAVSGNANVTISYIAIGRWK